MKVRTAIGAVCGLLCIGGVLYFLFINHTSTKAEPTISSQQDPIKGFPAHNLAALRDSGEASLIRSHAWNLLEQLTHDLGTGPDKHPDWETWHTKCTTGPLSLYCAKSISTESAVQQPNSGPANQFSTVYYSTDLANWILANHLHDSVYLYKQLTASAPNNQPAVTPTNITPPAPDTSIAVKEVWEVVNPGPDGSFTIPVYDPKNFGPKVDNLQNPYTKWCLQATMPCQVSLKLNQDKTLDQTSRCQFGATPIQLKDLDSPLPADCFVYRYTSGPCNSIVTFNRPRPHPINNGLDPTLACVGVLMGVQIMTREYLPNWTWSAFWWTADPVQQDDHSVDMSDGRPPDLGAGFHNFAMDTMLPRDDNPDQQGTLSPVFNPYLEGPTQHGPRSNCLQCHYKASYVPQSVPTPGPNSVGPRNGLPKVDQGFLTGLIGPNNPDIAEDCTPQQLGDPVSNHCRLRTSFLWSLTTNQDPCSLEPVLMNVRLNRKTTRTLPTTSTTIRDTTGSPADPCN
jgi:hypothetical protein